MSGAAALVRRVAPQVAALAAVLVLTAVAFPGFFDVDLAGGRLVGSPIDILKRSAPVALLAIGMTLMIATRGIDLSVGSVMAIAGAVAAWGVTGGSACRRRSRSRWCRGSPATSGTGSSSPSSASIRSSRR